MDEEIRAGTPARRAKKQLCIALVLVLISCLGASMLQTSFGNVKILDFKIPVDNGKWIAGKLFKPNSASAKNKVPIVITCAGYLNNNQMQDSSAIELSRRGIAVMAMDAYFHGDSSSSENSVIDSTLREGTGMIPMVEFAYSQLDYIDTSRIGVMGHSMGGMDVWITLAHYGAQYNAAIAAARDPSSDGGAAITPKEQAAAEAQNKVCAGLASGNVRLSTPEFFQNIHANFAINYGKYDEGCYDLKRGNGDLSGACYESLSAVNSALPEGKKIASVEIGRLYGNAVDKSLRVVFNPPATHQMQHFSVRSTADNVTFFTSAFRMPPVMDARNQLWLLKEVFNGLGLIACLFAIVPIALLLLRLPAFAELVTPLPQALPALSSRKRKTVFWGGWILSWVVSWLSFMPVAKLDLVLFKGTATMDFASWFPQQTTNFIMLWAIFNGIVGLALFWGSYRLFGKKDGVTPEMWGIRTNAREILKTLVLAACVFVGFYAIAFGAEYFFHTDFRFWVVAICTFASKKLLIALEYIPLYFIFFAASSILTNSVNRVEGRKEWLNLLVCGLGNVLGIVALNAVQYVTLFATGAAHWQADRLYPLLAIPLIVPLFAAAYINRRLYTATGKVWLGAMVNCLIIVMIGVANTATLLPL